MLRLTLEIGLGFLLVSMLVAWGWSRFKRHEREQQAHVFWTTWPNDDAALNGPEEAEGNALASASRSERKNESRSLDGDGQHVNGRAAGELVGGDVRTVHAPSGLEPSQVRTAIGLRTGARHEDGIQGQTMKLAAGSEPADSHQIRPWPPKPTGYQKRKAG